MKSDEKSCYKTLAGSFSGMRLVFDASRVIVDWDRQDERLVVLGSQDNGTRWMRGPSLKSERIAE